MKSSFGLLRLLSIAIVLAAAAIIWTSWQARQVQAIQDSEDFPPPLGLAQDQTAGLSHFNSGETAIVGPEYRFLDSQGKKLAQCAESIVPGRFRSFDFDLPNPPPEAVDFFGRAQMRVAVTIIGNPDKKTLRVSVEAFDNATRSRTSFVISPPPSPDSIVL